MSGYEKAVPGAYCYSCRWVHEVTVMEDGTGTCHGCGAAVEKALVCVPVHNVGGMRDAYGRARRRVQYPTSEVHAGPGGSPTTVFKHPAFGQFTVSRVQGDAHLYGSEFRHNGFIALRVTRSELHRDLSRDWCFPREELIEVVMSEAQWATAISTPNSGTGVQCTLRYVNGETPIPSLPRAEPKSDTFKAEVKQAFKESTEAMAELRALIESGKGGKKALELLARAERKLTDSMPFVAKSFGEHIETVTETAKVEINAYMEQQVARLGQQALAAGAPLDLTDAPAAAELPAPPMPALAAAHDCDSPATCGTCHVCQRKHPCPCEKV